jgi:hypothetical protein
MTPELDDLEAKVRALLTSAGRSSNFDLFPSRNLLADLQVAELLFKGRATTGVTIAGGDWEALPLQDKLALANAVHARRPTDR